MEGFDPHALQGLSSVRDRILGATKLSRSGTAFSVRWMREAGRGAVMLRTVSRRVRWQAAYLDTLAAEPDRRRESEAMLKGLYKVDMSTVDGTRRGVVYCYDDKILGGNSVYGFIGTQRLADDGEIVVEIATIRHNFDPNFQPLLKADEVTVMLRGRPEGEQHRFQGSIAQLPGVAFNVLITPLSEAAAPPVPLFQERGIKNGLYSIHILMLDGVDGGNTGVVVLHDGKMRGGDAFFDYVGAYASANGRWRGELVNHEHTPSQGERSVFGGYEVGIGFSGTYRDEIAVADAVALAGKRSIRFSAVLKKLADG